MLNRKKRGFLPLFFFSYFCVYNSPLDFFALLCLLLVWSVFIMFATIFCSNWFPPWVFPLGFASPIGRVYDFKRFTHETIRQFQISRPDLFRDTILLARRTRPYNIKIMHGILLIIKRHYITAVGGAKFFHII